MPAVDHGVVQAPVVERPAWNGKTNGFSIAALTMAMFGCALPVSTAFGIAGLVQSRRNGDKRGRVFATIALVINGLLVVAFAVAIVISQADGPDRDASGAVRGERSIGITRLRPGDCIKEISATTGNYVDVVPCDREHNSEVFALFDLAADDAGQEAADAGCESRFPEYASGSAAVLALPPDSGERRVTCLTFRLSPTTGSIKR